MRIYISGKITGLDLNESETLFNVVEEHLISEGHQVVNPWKVLPFHPDHKWEDYMLKDIEEIFKCDEVYMLNNWGTSKGARVERAIAIELGLKITYQP